MSFNLFASTFYHRLATNVQSLCRIGLWTGLLVMVAAVAVFSPVFVFLWAAYRCEVDGYIRFPLDMPGNSVCLPAHVVKGPSFDDYIPVIFAPILVACSGLVLSCLSLSHI